MDLKAYEDSVLKYWTERGVNIGVKRKNLNGKKFYFLDGPPYATGELGFYHVWVTVTKDLMLRYKRYRGYDVHDRAGFDVHGLPIEVKVEKQLNISSKKDISERVGVSAFIEKCKSFADEQIKLAIPMQKRYGVSLDFDSTYIPYKKEYMEQGWSIFKRIYDKKLVYEGNEPLAYCPHCETVLSAQGPEVEYRIESDPSIFIRFKVKRGTSSVELPDSTYLAVWTTTPWTLVSNVAIAVNPKELYVVAEISGENYIIAKGRLEDFSAATGANLIIKSEFYGSELEGTCYESLFAGDVPAQAAISKYHKVIASESFVSANEGTGLLHVAPGHGPEDFKLGKEHRLPVLSPVDEHSRYTNEAGIFENLSVPSEANSAVLAYLKKSGALLFQGTVSHSYPHCWRCGSKLIYRATKQYYINVQKIKKKMLAQNKRIRWHPAFASEWFEEAIKSSPDWCISRQRYWGIPIPIWKCDSCGSERVIGSAAELSSLSNQKVNLDDLHRQHVDAITIKCAKCGGTMHRISDIFDVWYDSGISHTASLSETEFEKLFPADWISESADQIRGWFTTLLRTSVALYGKAPFLNVNIGGMVKDEMGQEMHRHLGNIVSASELLELSSADGFRFWCLAHPRWEELRLKKAELDEANSNIITIYNIAELAKELAQLAGINPRDIAKPPPRLELEERWIVSRLNSLIDSATKNLDGYAIDAAVRDMKSFMLDDMSRFYLKFAKQRAELGTRGDMKRIASLLAYVLKNALVMVSIVAPFAAEHIYQELFSNNDSIFMNGWPKPAKGKIDKALEDRFSLFKDVANAVLSLREQKNAKLRWPISRITIKTASDSIAEALGELEPLIEMYANAKSLKVEIGSISKTVIKPMFAKLGPAFKDNAQMIADTLAAQDADIVLGEISAKGYYALHTDKGVFNVLPDYFAAIQSAASEGAANVRHGDAIMAIDIDAELTEELRKELLKREFIRRVQLMRKEMELKKLARVNLYAAIPEKFVPVMSQYAGDIKKIAGISRISYNGDMPQGAYKKSWNIFDEEFIIALEKI
ncbi:MAG: isoleucine--tRNA ligase [Candidatus Micrarchaeaceae archaeon]